MEMGESIPKEMCVGAPPECFLLQLLRTIKTDQIGNKQSPYMILQTISSRTAHDLPSIKQCKSNDISKLVFAEKAIICVCQLETA